MSFHDTLFFTGRTEGAPFRERKELQVTSRKNPADMEDILIQKPLSHLLHLTTSAGHSSVLYGDMNPDEGKTYAKFTKSRP